MAITRQELVLTETNELPKIVEQGIHSNCLSSLSQCFHAACSSGMVCLHVQKAQNACKALTLHTALYTKAYDLTGMVHHHPLCAEVKAKQIESRPETIFIS